MDDPILEKRLKNMFESRAGELPDESVRKARIRRNVYEKIEREGNYMKKGFMKKAVASEGEWTDGRFPGEILQRVRV